MRQPDNADGAARRPVVVSVRADSFGAIVRLLVEVSSRKRLWLLASLLVITVLIGLIGVRFAAGTHDSPTTTSLPPNDEVVQMQGGAPLRPPKEVDAARAIVGQVVKPNGEPAVGVTVIVQAPGHEDPWEATTDVGGMFRFDELPLLLYAVEASLDGYGPAFVIGVVPGGAPLRLVLQTGRELNGQLLRKGDVVAHGIVHVGGPGLFPQRAQAAEANGRFRVAGLRAGTYETIAVAPGVSSGFVDNIAVDSDGRADIQLEMLLAPRVDVRVHDRKTGQPIEAGVITIATRPFHVLALHALISEGEAIIDFLPPGEYWIRVRAPGYKSHEGRFWVTAAGGAIDLALSQGATVSGHVVDQAGNPIAGATMRAVVETTTGGRFDLNSASFEVFHRLARPNGTPFWWPTSDYVTDARGRFEISGIPAGSAVIVGRREGYATGMSPSLAVQHDQHYGDLRIVLERGRQLRGRVENAAGAPVAGAAVSAVASSLPAWVGGRSLITDRSGAFLFRELPGSVRLSVRHPDFGVSTQTLDLGERGLDDHIVRLSNHHEHEYTGRVLTTQKGPAVGARVWVMSGASSIPSCTAVTDARGHFQAQQCSARAERIIISHDQYAPLLADIVDPSSPVDWVLRAGGQIDVVAQRHAALVGVEAEFFLPLEAWKRPVFELERWHRHTLTHLAPGSYRVICTVDGYAPASIDVTVVADQRVEAVCPIPHRVAAQDIAVVDLQGAPVAGAELWIEGLGAPLRVTTSAQGRVRVEGAPGRWIRIHATHESWGEGEGAVQLPREAAEPYRLVLADPIGGKNQDAFLRMLESWGIHAAKDHRSILIDDTQRGSPAAGIGLQRGDKILWARPQGESRLSVGVRRRNEVVLHELVRGEP